MLAELEPATGGSATCNAGHNPGPAAAARRRGRGAAGSGGLPLGLLPGARYQLATLEVEPGDLLCLYSDGITECAAPDDEEYGLERLERLLRTERERPLPEITRRVDGAMLEFAAGSCAVRRSDSGAATAHRLMTSDRDVEP